LTATNYPEQKYRTSARPSRLGGRSGGHLTILYFLAAFFRGGGATLKSTVSERLTHRDLRQAMLEIPSTKNYVLTR
jgi:hypothetical protein